MSKSNKCDNVIKQALHDWACKTPVHQAIKRSLCGGASNPEEAIIGIEPKAPPVAKKKTTIVIVDDKKKDKEDDKKEDEKS